MSKMQTVGTVSKNLGISSRMLRYYEQVGLVESQRIEDYAYRVYDEDAIKRLRHIIILRKLRVPVKQIKEIFENRDAESVIDVFERNISALDEEITALSTLRSILNNLARELREKANVRLHLDLLGDSSVLAIVESISLPNNIIQEEKNMSDLNKVGEILDKVDDKDVRIVYLPPATVAAVHFVGNDEEGRIPEDQGEEIIDALVKELAKIKPDCRHYGFNHGVGGKHGYERWFTIPDDMEVPPPFVKKQFAGGVYGAYLLRTWDSEWDLLVAWANQHEKYDFAQGDINMMLGILEEHLNVMGQYALPDAKHDAQVDLLIPLKEKSEWTDNLGYIADSESKCGYRASLIEKEAFTVVGLADDGQYKIATDGRLELLQAASTPGTPILVYHNIDSKFNICVDENAADKKQLRSSKGSISMRTKKVSKTRYIQFEMTMDDMKDHTWEKFNPHNVVRKLGYKFDGSNGFFFVYNCREIETTEENKNEPFYCWMPVIPI